MSITRKSVEFATKKCRACGLDQPHSEFWSAPRNRDGLHSYCKSCDRIRARNRPNNKANNARWYRENREHRLALGAEWRRNNAERMKESNRKWMAANPESVRLNQVARNSRRRVRMKAAQRIEFTAEQLAGRWAYYGDQCWMCRSVATETDHVKPIARGGAHMLANLRPICRPCNSGKRDRWPL